MTAILIGRGAPSPSNIPDWSPLAQYNAGEEVIESNVMHTCLLGHVSGNDFAQDKASGKWTALVSEFEHKAESVAAENIGETDSVLTQKLVFLPVNLDEFELHFNGVRQEQGVNKDFTVNATTGEITWLGSSGTAIMMDVTDLILINYKHANISTP